MCLDWQANTCGVVERVLNWARVKSQSQLNKKQGGSKHSRLRGIPKLDDANEAGGKNALDCTLIVTEGDSAKSLAVSGLGVIGRDNYGVFPLRGKLLNVREASHAQVWSAMEACFGHKEWSGSRTKCGCGVGVVWLHYDVKVHTLICNLLVIFAVIHFGRVDVVLYLY